ncbi:hypothetical protein EUGRSUZ_I02270 [Eucalyptus grandis]|uniref:Uncharacterized protein n=2 Tax=Eucalyptus grandis TaxID=71139 RepID=A0ACC3JHH2_EUCGR|nr:hypothetical protein EUGRSUZ_I02270 [Eucalyptus grandis]
MRSGSCQDMPKCLAIDLKNSRYRNTIQELDQLLLSLAAEFIEAPRGPFPYIFNHLQTLECPENHEFVWILNETELTLSCNQ